MRRNIPEDHHFLFLMIIQGRRVAMIWTGAAVLTDKLHHCEHPTNVLVADARLEISAYADRRTDGRSLHVKRPF
jgi:hypothetical protein